MGDQPGLAGRLSAGLLVGLTRLISGAQSRWMAGPPSGKPSVFYANHSSHLDFILLWSSLPPALRAKTRPVAGRDYWQRGRLKRYLAEKVFNTLLVDRFGPAADAEEQRARAAASIGQITAGMGEGTSIIIFPEGTRSLDGAVKPFKSGLYHIHRLKPQWELVPVFLENLNRILPKGEILPVPLIGSVTFGAPLQGLPGESKEDFLGRARQALLDLERA